MLKKVYYVYKQQITNCEHKGALKQVENNKRSPRRHKKQRVHEGIGTTSFVCGGGRIGLG